MAESFSINHLNPFTGWLNRRDTAYIYIYILGNLATVLIWWFGNLEDNGQIKKPPIIRYQSRPDTRTAASPSSNKCACVRRQSYTRWRCTDVPEERRACCFYPVHIICGDPLSLERREILCGTWPTIVASRVIVTVYMSWVLLASPLQASCSPIAGFQIPRNTWWPRTQLSTSYVSIFYDLAVRSGFLQLAVWICICEWLRHNFLFDRWSCESPNFKFTKYLSKWFLSISPNLMAAKISRYTVHVASPSFDSIAERTHRNRSLFFWISGCLCIALNCLFSFLTTYIQLHSAPTMLERYAVQVLLLMSTHLPQLQWGTLIVYQAAVGVTASP